MTENLGVWAALKVWMHKYHKFHVKKCSCHDYNYTKSGPKVFQSHVCSMMMEKLVGSGSPEGTGVQVCQKGLSV